jgi:hypothetical protein
LIIHFLFPSLHSLFIFLLLFFDVDVVCLCWFKACFAAVLVVQLLPLLLLLLLVQRKNYVFVVVGVSVFRVPFPPHLSFFDFIEVSRPYFYS